MWEHDYIFLAGDDVPPDQKLPQSENLIEDDVDQLFMTRLPQLKPPPELISRILFTTANLPGSASGLLRGEQPGHRPQLDGPLLRKEKEA